MTRPRILTLGALLGALALFIVYTITTPAVDPTLDYDAVVEADAPNLEGRSERGRRMELGAGYPDLYEEMHRDIRTAEGEDAPRYPANYQLNELRKARVASKGGRQLNWLARGPGNVGGRTRALVVDPADPTNTWLAGSVGGGIWRTTDRGQTWTPVTDDLPNLAITTLGMAESNPNILYAGTGEGFGNLDAIGGAGLFKSTDRGLTWAQLPATADDFDFRFVNRLAIDPNNPDVVVVVTNTGIFRTSDGGATWTEVYDGRGRVQDLQPDPRNFNMLYATENSNAILRSTDAGQTWAQVFTGFIADTQRMELAVAPSNPSWVYVAAQAANSDGSGRSDIYLSQDSGVTWSPVLDQGPEENWLGTQGWYDNAIAVHPLDHTRVLLGGITFWQTVTDEGGVQVIRRPSAFEENGTAAFMDFVTFNSGEFFGGRLALGDNLGEEDFRSIEMRFGPGLTQRAHRFTVSATGGTNGDGGAGIGFSDYQYAGYDEVPFQVWDLDANEQLMVSYRDQADNGVFDLIPRNTEGSRNEHSREYYFIHAIPYNGATQDPSIARNGGLTHRQMYFMWPFLAEGGSWNNGNVGNANLRIIYSTTEALARATDQFPQNLRFGGSVHVDHHNIQAFSYTNDQGEEDVFIINTNDGGVAYSEDDGGTWTEVDRGYVTSQFYDVAKRPGVDQYIGGTQDNGTWRSFANATPSQGWTKMLGGDGFDVIWHPDDANLMLGSIQFNNIQRSTNGGASWSAAQTGLGDVGRDDGGQFLTALEHSPDVPDRVFTSGATGVWRSDNFGLTWTDVPIRTRWGFSSSGRVRISKANPDVVWAGHRMSSTATLHLSRNGGQFFAPVQAPDIAPGRLSGLATHPAEDGTAYALFSAFSAPKILRTTDFGQTWQDLSGYDNSIDGTSTRGFPNVAVYDLLVLPDNPGVLWAATEIGIVESRDNGTTWAYADNGLPAVAIWRLKLQDNQILAATHGRGIWTLDASLAVSTEDDIAESADLPQDYALESNYPNPFNPTTTIPFAVPEASRVTLTVYDVTGRRIATLADGDYAPGRHRVTWNAEGFASGMYLLRLEAGDVVHTRQLTLLK